MQQAMEGNGVLDEGTWKKTFLPLMHQTGKIKKMSMLEAARGQCYKTFTAVSYKFL